jgi:hypothetical protein
LTRQDVSFAKKPVAYPVEDSTISDWRVCPRSGVDCPDTEQIEQERKLERGTLVLVTHPPSLLGFTEYAGNRTIPEDSG